MGCGYWGRNLVRVLHRLGALQAVVERSASARELARQIAPGVRTHSRPEPIWRNPEIDGLVVATPAETHFEIARAALDAGKDVFVEKPLATDLESALSLHRRADELGRVLMVGHLLEYHPAILKLHELIRAGTLGKLFYITSNRLNLGKIRAEENALWSFAPHDVSVILRLLGAGPCQVSATGGSYIQPNIVDATVTQLLFEDGARAHVYVSWLHPFKEQRLVIIGSERMASYDDVAKSLILYDRHVDWKRGQPVPSRGEGAEVPFPQYEPLHKECQHFLECVATRSRPLTDGANGVQVLQVLSAAQRSLMTGGHPVSLEVAGGGRPQPPVSRGLSVRRHRSGSIRRSPVVGSWTG